MSKLPPARQDKIDEIKEPLLSILGDAVDDKSVPITTAVIEAATASISATACVVALLPDEGSRRAVSRILFGKFEEHVEKRAVEIRSGAFDHARERARN